MKRQWRFGVFGPEADRYSEDAVPKMVDFRDPARSVLTAREHHLCRPSGLNVDPP